MTHWYKKAKKTNKPIEKVYRVCAQFFEMPNRKVFVPFRGYQWRFRDSLLRKELGSWKHLEPDRYSYYVYEPASWFYMTGRSKQEVKEKVVAELLEADPKGVKDFAVTAGRPYKPYYDALVQLIGSTKTDPKGTRLPRFSARLRAIRTELEKL